ncbi:hypothetical protein MTsPCn5_24850 [Croceitalea sp. MTPC5]|uniref:hypothetical protein n=1 Tax=Croceitalea sp. MTPC5 TaxID=3056565 RepID=UPI002B3A9F09|nr:hypothetical protein MTsPCn5_24850 [Croceitalea sp. MTPC5]
MILKHGIASLLVLCATCCPEDDCATVLCEGPPTLAFDLELDNANVFQNEIYALEDIRISGDNADDFTLELATFDAEKPESILVLQNFDWSIGTSENSLIIADTIVIPLTIEIVLSESDGCCGGIARLKSLVIHGATQEDLNGFYTISLD